MPQERGSQRGRTRGPSPEEGGSQPGGTHTESRGDNPCPRERGSLPGGDKESFALGWEGDFCPRKGAVIPKTGGGPRSQKGGSHSQGGGTGDSYPRKGQSARRGPRLQGGRPSAWGLWDLHHRKGHLAHRVYSQSGWASQPGG